MSYYQIYVFLRLSLLLSIIATVKSRPNITTSQAQTDLNSDNAALDVTGELYEEVNGMKRSCGVREKDLRINNRHKRYALDGAFWNVKNLTYNILNYPTDMTETEVDNEIARAFSVWSEQTNLIFTHQKTGKVNIKIEFLKFLHGNCTPFVTSLAHATFSQEDAFIHFHVDEDWTFNSPDGYNLFQVAVHEIGHVLGLKHSDKKGSVMVSDYEGYKPNFKLDDDDIQAAQYLYGNKSLPNINGPFRDFAVPSSNKSLPDLLPSVPQDNDLCKNPKIDAIFKSGDNQTYVFKGEKYYKLAGNLVADGYPKLISDGWPGLPGDIDAAFAYKNGKIYFFKDTKYWRYNGSKMDVGYPKEISEGFPGIPDHLDTAVPWDDSGKIFFFKGNQFWSFDPTKEPQVKSSYINLYLNWKGLPGNFNAAYIDDYGLVNFFKNDRLYQINTSNKPSITNNNGSLVIPSIFHFSLPSGVYFGCFDIDGYVEALYGSFNTTST